MRKKTETRKKFRRICALVVVGMFVVMTLPTSVVAPPGDTPWNGGGDVVWPGDALGTTNLPGGPEGALVFVAGGDGVPYTGIQRMVIDHNTGFVGIALPGDIWFPPIPVNQLDVGGNMAVGEGFAGAFPAPPNGMIIEGPVGIGTPEPMEALDVVGNIHASDTLISGNSITIDGTNDKITASSGTINFDNENLVTTGNVGIGTTSPTEKLDVNGRAKISGSSGSSVPILNVTNNGVGSFSHGICSYSGWGSSSWGILARGRGAGGGVAGISEGWHGVYGECKHDFQDHAAIRGHNSGGGWAGYFTGGESYFSDNVGIGTTSPSQRLHVAGNARITGALYDSNNDAGTSGQVLMTTGIGIDWVDLSIVTDGDWDITTNPPHMFSIPTGNVGIGTMTPMNKLDVAGNMAVGVTYAGTTPAPPNGMLIEGTNGFVFPPTGGVGIGVPVAPIGFPAGQLHVDLPFPAGPGVLLPDNIVEVTRIGVTGAFTPTGMTDYGITLGIYDDEGYPVIQAFDQIFQDPNIPEAGVPLYINPNPATPSGWAANTILNLNSGSVGIGTASPVEALDVVGNVHASGSFISGSTTTYGDGFITLSTGTDLNIDSGTLFIDNANDRVGIGTTNPANLLDVYDANPAIGADAVVGIRSADSNAYLKFSKGGATYSSWLQFDDPGQTARWMMGQLGGTYDFVIYSSAVNPFLKLDYDTGNVGIGTTSPDEKLHVVGNIKMVDGNQGTGKVLTSDANGVGSWQAIAKQNLFETIDAPIGTDPVADNPTDTLQLIQGGIVTITGDTTNDRITIDATEVDGDTTNELQNLAEVYAHDGATGNAVQLTAANGDIRFYNDDATPKEMLFLDESSGRIGIGTTNPANLLDVYDANSAIGADAVVGIRSADSNAYLKFSKGGATYSSWLQFDDPGQVGRWMMGQFGGTYDFFIYSAVGYVLNLDYYTGNVGIGTVSPTGKLDVNGNDIRIRSSQTPTSASASGNTGEICWDQDYIYVCVGTNTWKRAAISTW